MSVRVYVPRDSSALSVGAEEVANAIAFEAARRNADIALVRNGSRGLYWLEPMVEVETPSGRIAFDPATHLAKQGDDYMPTVFYQVTENGGKAIVSPAQYADQTFQQPYWMTTKPAKK